MGLFDTFTFPAGRVAFEGMVRADPGGARVFRVELPGCHPMYGEWQVIPVSDPDEFDIEIVSFGYLSKENVRNPHPDARKSISLQEQGAVKALVAELFSVPSKTNEKIPFTFNKRPFSGNLVFAKRWTS